MLPMTAIDLSGYLDRIGLERLDRSAEGLAALQAAQLRAIPFENIDPFLGRVPALDLDALQRKLLRELRGGYCFELNGLLFATLLAAGVAARRVLARVRMGQPRGGARSHMAIVALASGRRLLLDAGFGGPGPLAPLGVDVDGPQAAPNGVFRLVHDATSAERIVQRQTDEGWFSLYGFDETPVGDADIAAANHLCATWSGAPFPSHLMLNAWKGETRFGLFDRALTVERDGSRESAKIADGAAFARTMGESFGLALDEATLQAVWLRLAPEVGAVAV